MSLMFAFLLKKMSCFNPELWNPVNPLCRNNDKHGSVNKLFFNEAWSFDKPKEKVEIHTTWASTHSFESLL